MKIQNWLALATFVGLGLVTAQAEVVTSDSFEATTFAPAWEQDGNWVICGVPPAYDGVRYASVHGPAGGTLTQYISTACHEQIFVTYAMRIEGALSPDDYFVFEWTADGTTWEPFLIYTDTPPGEWEFRVIALPPEADWNPDFGFRFVADFDSPGARVSVDLVEVWGQPLPPPPPSWGSAGTGGVKSPRRP